MRVIWVCATVSLGAIGALALLRTIERLATGAGLLPAQLVIALVGLGGAWACLGRARAKNAAHPS